MRSAHLKCLNEEKGKTKGDEEIVLTVYGIETRREIIFTQAYLQNITTVLTACGIETLLIIGSHFYYLPCCNNTYRFAVCAAECETEEEPSDDEVRTSQVPETK